MLEGYKQTKQVVIKVIQNIHQVQEIKNYLEHPGKMGKG